MSVPLATCRIHRLCLPSSSIEYDKYLPSGEIAATVERPLDATRVILISSNGVEEALRFIANAITSAHGMRTTAAMVTTAGVIARWRARGRMIGAFGSVARAMS